jgi:amino acid permease
LELCNAFFVTVATILGTGILALPVELSESGFWPFVVTFFVCFLMQLAVVLLAVELLQHAHISMGRSQSNTQENIFETLNFDGFSDAQMPDLHRMGRMFLEKKWMAQAFDTAVVIHFVAVLISYTLAGAQAYGNLFALDDFRVLIVPFCVVYTSFIVFCGNSVRPVISFLTVCKCAALVAVIAAVEVIGHLVDIQQTDNFAHAMEPFLMGTFALGGVVNLMPVVYAKLPFIGGKLLSEQQKQYAKAQNGLLLSRFRLSICLGVAFCFVLNILWCAFVLEVVPQTEAASEAHSTPEWLVGKNISLARSMAMGEISTIPVIKVIEMNYPSYKWVVVFINMFVIISVTVSYLTLGTGLKHMLDGISLHLEQGHQRQDDNVELRGESVEKMNEFHKSEEMLVGKNDEYDAIFRSVGGEEMLGESSTAARKLRRTKYALYLLGFGLILAVALLNPQGFIVLLSVFGSFALNIECGVFVALMARAVRTNGAFSRQNVPCSLGAHGSLLERLEIFSTWSFSFAICYDFVTAGEKFGMSAGIWLSISLPILFLVLGMLFRSKIVEMCRRNQGLPSYPGSAGNSPYTKVEDG